MVDIHSHIIWGIDDGSKDKDMTIQMLKQAIESGTKHIIATPHFTRGYFEVSYNELNNKFKELKSIIKEEGLDIQVYLGQEVYYKENLIENYENGEIGTINGSKYMLLELPMREFDIDKVLDQIYELQVKGIKIILAHPERYIPFIKNPTAINRFIEEGFLFQLNAGSLVGDFNNDVQKLAHKYLEAGIYSFMGSDGHKPDKRNCNIIKTVNLLNNIDDKILNKFTENGMTLIDNREINFLGKKIEKYKKNSNKKGFLQRIFGK